MRLKKKWFIPLGILALSSWFLYRENNQIETTAVTVQSDKLPAAFDDYKILQIADLHGKSFGSRQKYLLKKIDKLQPDLILMTGDLIDSRRDGEADALLLMEKLTADYPVYFVTGNHEVRRNFTILPKLEQLGVTVLRNTSVPLEREGQFIELLGIDDPTTTRWSEGLQEPDGIRQSLDQAQSTVDTTRLPTVDGAPSGILAVVCRTKHGSRPVRACSRRTNPASVDRRHVCTGSRILPGTDSGTTYHRADKNDHQPWTWQQPISISNFQSSRADCRDITHVIHQKGLTQKR